MGNRGKDAEGYAKRARNNCFEWVQITSSLFQILAFYNPIQFFPVESMASEKLTHCTPGEGAKPVIEMSQDQVITEKQQKKPGYYHTL